MNLTYFRPKTRGNVKKKTTTQSTSDLSPKHQTSEIQPRKSHLTSCNIRSGNTGINDPELLVKSRSRSRTAPLFRHKG